MTTTASSFSIQSKSTWSGVRFSVVDTNQNVLFESDTRRPAIAAHAYLENGANFISIINNSIRLKGSSFLEFNSLITQFRLGRPLTKELLCKGEIVMNKGTLKLEEGFYTSSNQDICITGLKTLLDVFNTISKELKHD